MAQAQQAALQEAQQAEAARQKKLQHLAALNGLMHERVTAGYQIGDQLSNDPDVVAVATVLATMLVGAATEAAYYLARKFGWER